MKPPLLLLAALCAAGCVEEPDTTLAIKPPVNGIESGSRVEITRIGLFKDDLAYENRRGIYLIKDKKTGKEFLGVSGIGITEVGSHQNDDDTHEDER